MVKTKKRSDDGCDDEDGAHDVHSFELVSKRSFVKVNGERIGEADIKEAHKYQGNLKEEGPTRTVRSLYGWSLLRGVRTIAILLSR